ncbi:MAG: DUF1302 family protein [Myxococcota bacterium]|nr:DUF1302 family protein [Myxococcota bacterium]MEC9391861.1 DUF1302 family protein [Myxococcota bacterium]
MLAWILATQAVLADRPPEVGLTVQPLLAVDLQHETDNEDTIESWTWIHARAKHRTAQGEWFFGAHAAHNVRHGVDTESIWHVDLGETGAAGTVGAVHGRIGNLIERWGKLDLTPVVDVLNPRDLRAGPLGTVEALRVPIPMATLQARGRAMRLEVTYAPFPQPDKIQTIGSDYSAIRPGMLDGAIAEVATWEGESAALLTNQLAQLGSLVAATAPSTVRTLSDGLANLERPEETGLNGNAGVRMELEGRGVDAAVMAANLRSAMPESTLSPTLQSAIASQQLPALAQLDGLLVDAPLAASWPRTWLVGAEASTVLGPIGFRGETAWWSNRVVQQPWFSSSTTPATAAGIGLDWAHGTTVLVSAEARWTRLLDPPEALALIGEDTVDLGATLRVADPTEAVSLLAAAMWSATFDEWLARPEIQWRVSDPIQLSLGAILIGGPQPPPSTLFDSLRYTGGPLTLASENDAVFASIRWIH